MSRLLGRFPCLAAVVLFVLAGCEDLEPLVGGTAAPMVTVKTLASADLESVLPTDLVVRPDGTTLVLDGYRGRILSFAADGTSQGVWAGRGLGRPVRIGEARDGGVWAAVPGEDGEGGLLLLLGSDGAVTRVVAPHAADGAAIDPVDVLELADVLVVADRLFGVYWIDPVSGDARAHLTKNADQSAIRRVVDLAATPGGGIVAVDTLAPALLGFTIGGEARSQFGRTGYRVGTLSRPTSAGVAANGDVLVADSVLNAVQVFEPDGDVVGVLGDSAGILHFDHPVAVRVSAGDVPTVVVLEARPARLRWLALEHPLPSAPPPALVRTTLAAVDPDPAGKAGEACLSCHDGLVLDSREVWDPARKHHPVDVVPERPLPPIFRLDSGGRMVCTTCHSPHGVVEATEAAVDAPQLVRHRSAGSPFVRLEKSADTLCLACHENDRHVNAGAMGLGAPGGHPTGGALMAALERRPGAASTEDPTRGTCLSCHAMHGATGDPITRDPSDGSTCLGCHARVGEGTHNHPLGHVPGADLLEAHRGAHVQLSGSGGIGCLTCHDLEGRRGNHLVRTLAHGGSVCLDCHADRTDLQGGPHAHLAGQGSPTCVACHALHGGARADHFLTATAGNGGDPGGCLSCHGSGSGAGGAPKLGRVGHPVDGRAVEGRNPLTCLSCHDPHEAKAPVARACEECHAEQAADANRGGHGTADCVDCHPAHHAAPQVGGDVNPASARCLACHAPDAAPSDAPRVADWEHPTPMFRPDGSRWTPLGGLTLFDPRGKPTAGAENGDLTCQSCHLVHGPSAAGDDHLRRSGGWQAACSSCHGDDALVLYRYFHQPDRRQDVRGGAP